MQVSWLTEAEWSDLEASRIATGREPRRLTFDEDYGSSHARRVSTMFALEGSSGPAARRSILSVIPCLAQNSLVLSISRAMGSNSPVVPAITALTAFTRSRRPRSVRSTAFVMTSREPSAVSIDSGSAREGTPAR